MHVKTCRIASIDGNSVQDLFRHRNGGWWHDCWVYPKWGRLRIRNLKYAKPLASLSKTEVYEKSAQASGASRKIKALRFSKIILEIYS
jgi:hypothetical protein